MKDVKMEDDSHLNESPGHPIQYNQLNEQFGDLSSDNPNEPGVTMKALMAVCVENMVAYSQKMIKDYLNEAMDHKVVLEKHDNDGHSFLYMNYPIQTLEKMANDEFK